MSSKGMMTRFSGALLAIGILYCGVNALSTNAEYDHSYFLTQFFQFKIYH
ncbi:hypothetical protein FIU95_11820 [Microbulbifer sp. THAF38]|nr:hypothetical protein FIU95_11820 [Microbulbifer sp. THAF38]